MKRLVLVFLGIGFLVYFQSLFNGFVWDDFDQIIRNDTLYGWGNLPNVLFYHWSPYYKPIFYVSLSILLNLFGSNPFHFHLVQLLIHIANSALIFILFKNFFKYQIAFVMSIVFLVHPAISEAVLYVSALQDVLYFFFGIIALNILARDKKSKHFILIVLFLALAIFSKETGIAFLAISALYKILFNRDYLKRYILTFTFLFSVYAYIRFFYLNVKFFNPEFQPFFTYDADLLTRVFTMPKIVFNYLTLFVYPEKLQIFQLWWVRHINVVDFWIPLVSVVLFFGVLVAFLLRAFINKKKEASVMFFFLLWLVLGFLLHLHFIPLGMTLAERWFYLPLVGLLGTIAYILNDIISSPTKIKIFYVLSIIFILLLSVRTFTRSFDWQDKKTLANHDFNVDQSNLGTYFILGEYYQEIRDLDKAEELYKKAKEVAPSNENTDYALADVQKQRGNLVKAEEILRTSKKETIRSKIIYGYLLLKLDVKEANSYLRQTLSTFPNSHELNVLYALSEYELGDRKTALEYVLKAEKLNPAKEYDKVYESMKLGEKIDYK
jgi:protein O-mannosyl-transferase